MNYKIILYPSNWLYNAGVMGLIFTYPEYFTFKNGSVELDINLFKNIDYESYYFKDGKVINLIGKNQFYPNYIDTKGNQKDIFIKYFTSFSELENSGFVIFVQIRITLIKTDIANLKVEIRQLKNFFRKSKISIWFTINFLDHQNLSSPIVFGI